MKRFVTTAISFNSHYRAHSPQPRIPVMASARSTTRLTCMSSRKTSIKFVASLVATFGGTTTKQGVFTVTPTPSKTMSQLVLTPVGTLSVFGFKTPVPYPFGVERTGYLVTNLDAAVRAAQAEAPMSS